MKQTAASKRKNPAKYAGEVISELRKVNWPTKQETLRLTGIVLVICIIMGAIMGALDYGFTELVANVFIGGG